MKFFKKTVSLILILFLISALSFATYAQTIEPFYLSGKIISVAHYGNTMEYPAYSIEAINSAFESGADCVSVSVRKTADGGFILSDSDSLGEISLEGNGMIISMLPLSQTLTLHLTDKFGRLTQYTVTDLSSALKSATENDKTLIIDCDWAYREDIYKCICENNAGNNSLIRTSSSKKDIQSFLNVTSQMCGVIGEYHGNILFSARSYITSVSKLGCKMIFLGTKNSFGEIFRSSVLSAFSKTGYSARAAMKSYDMNETGGKPDCEVTWSDIIDRGYSVIETDRITDLLSYIEKLENERASLQTLLTKSENTETAFLTAQSISEINSATATAKTALTTISSFDKLSLAKSRLNLALNTKVLTDSPESTNEGVFSVTAGKIIAIVLVTLAIIIVQVYFYYRRADKKKPQWLNKLLNK